MKPPKSSLRKLAANRINARASTGPKTATGKKRAAQNARRHGLSIPVLNDPTLSADVKNLARAILSSSRVGSASDEQRALATEIAEAQIELVRARHARHHALSLALNNPNYVPLRIPKKSVTTLVRVLDMIEQGKPIPDDMERALASFQPEGPDKLASILMDHVENLSAIARYERRALSRRKFAIRKFDTSSSIG
jgi:hypothetical protein